MITRLSNDVPAVPEVRDGGFWPGKSDRERAFPPTADPTSPEIDRANGNKNGRFFTVIPSKFPEPILTAYKMSMSLGTAIDKSGHPQFARSFFFLLLHAIPPVSQRNNPT